MNVSFLSSLILSVAAGYSRCRVLSKCREMKERERKTLCSKTRFKPQKQQKEVKVCSHTTDQCGLIWSDRLCWCVTFYSFPFSSLPSDFCWRNENERGLPETCGGRGGVTPPWNSASVVIWTTVAAAIKKLKGFNQHMEDAPHVLLCPDAGGGTNTPGADTLSQCRSTRRRLERPARELHCTSANSWKCVWHVFCLVFSSTLHHIIDSDISFSSASDVLFRISFTHASSHLLLWLEGRQTVCCDCWQKWHTWNIRENIQTARSFQTEQEFPR